MYQFVATDTGVVAALVGVYVLPASLLKVSEVVTWCDVRAKFAYTD